MSINPTLLARNEATAAGAGQSIAASTDYDLSIPATARDDHFLLLEVTTTAAGDLTVAAGDNPPAFRAGLGGLTFSLGASANVRILLDPARHVRNDGVIRISTGTGIAGTLRWFVLSRGRNE